MSMDLLGYGLFDGSSEICADAMFGEITGGRRDCHVMACLNPHSYVVAREDPAFNQALQAADWLVPDGAGIVLASYILGPQRLERVSGPDVFAAVMDRLNRSNGSVFFLGSSQATLDKIADRLAQDYPGIRLAGSFSPPFTATFSEQENREMIDTINAARPDVLWVGMTAPKQEKWLLEHRDRLDVPVAGAIGGAFDFLAGTVQRSPKIFRDLGLEWLPRLVQQPRRLWRRMGVSAPIFLADVLKSSLRRLIGAR